MQVPQSTTGLTAHLLGRPGTGRHDASAPVARPASHTTSPVTSYATPHAHDTRVAPAVCLSAPAPTPSGAAPVRPSVRAENPLEWALLRLGLAPLPLLDGYWGMATSRALLTAIDLGVFDALAGDPLTCEELATRLGTDPLGTRVLLGALCGMRYLRCSGRRYRTTRTVRRWLADGALVDLRDSVLFFDDLWGELSDLTALVRSGETRNLHLDGRGPEFWRHYLRGLAAFVPLVSGEVARKVALPSGARTLLDVGGGHGMYAAAFLRRHGALTATVLDLPEACAVGRECIAEVGLADRFTWREADARTADWGGPYDAVLLFNLVHNLSWDENADAFRRAYDALAPGGTVAVLDSEYEGEGGGISLTAGLNEMLFYLTTGTRVYPEATIRDWMAGSGLRGIRTRHLASMPQMALITATRPRA
ncbi:MAG: methyltransferase domain-containing protein [Actinobacteria bacterium]|nr:MAG: methyltransferase domain-containing protein [Actinomycetota bacterium]